MERLVSSLFVIGVAFMLQLPKLPPLLFWLDRRSIGSVVNHFNARVLYVPDRLGGAT